MTNCKFCQIIEGKRKVKKIYEDEKILAFLHPEPCTYGHIVLLPKEHFTIFEQIPDQEVGHLFDVANKLSTATFDSLGCGGTNMIVNNGTSAGQVVPHFSIDIVPRRENDGLNFQWQPKQLSEEEISTVEIILKEAAKDIGDFKKGKKEEVVEEDKKVLDKEDYMVKSLRRIP